MILDKGVCFIFFTSHINAREDKKKNQREKKVDVDLYASAASPQYTIRADLYQKGSAQESQPCCVPSAVACDADADADALFMTVILHRKFCTVVMCGTESAHRFSLGFTWNFWVDSGNHSKSTLRDIFYLLSSVPSQDIPEVGLHVL